MGLGRQELVDAIERGMFLVPPVPGYVEFLPIPGLASRVTPLAHPYANSVGLARLTSDDADDTVARVRDFFAEQEKGFRWIVGPGTTPPDLGERLAAAGFKELLDMAGMALEDLAAPIRASSSVRVREATREEDDLASRTMARAAPVSLDLTRFWAEVRLLVKDELEAHTYLAFLDGIDEPVGCAWMMYFPDAPIVELGGAATMAEHRGKGAYTSLVARRVADAYDRGATAAVIQAARATSAPVCSKLGFVEACGLTQYAWIPEGTREELAKEWGLGRR
jgi:hypothetical protein